MQDVKLDFRWEYLNVYERTYILMNEFWKVLYQN